METLNERRKTDDRTDVVCHWLCGNAGDHHRGRHGGSLHGKMMLTLAAAVELFTQGAALAVSVYLLWKQHDGKE